MRIAAAILTLTLAASARPDQCELMEKDPATRAAEILKEGSQVLTYCEPCGDTARRVPELETVRSVSVQQVEGNLWEVRVNGVARDIAYLFIKTGASRAENVAALAACPAVGVTRTIELGPGPGPAPPRPARARDARCTIELEGKRVLDGVCEFLPEGRDGSFSLSARGGTGLLLAEISVVSVSVVSPGVAEVRGLTTRGVNSRWGEARRSREDLACWKGDDFQICAR